MNELLQAVLEDPTVRGSKAITIAAGQAATDFGPWASESEM
ncbi:hypothetical protein BH09PAT3_BH09PAT3_0820 [soil metagenome]